MKRRALLFTPFLSGTFLAVFLFLSVSWAGPGPSLGKGTWKAVLKRPDGQEIVFNFETAEKNGKTVLYVLNAGERLLVDQVRFKKDSVFIQMPFFESSFRARLDQKGVLTGEWIKRLADREQVMPFTAVPHKKERFPAPKRPLYNVSGRWATLFTGFRDQKTEAVGEFVQKGSHLKGTFLTATGDYRYLEGVVSGDSLKLSGFDGGHALLFTARITSDSSLAGGRYYSGPAGMETWSARKDSTASLPDGYDQTHLRQGESKLDFRFKSIDGNEVSIHDERFKNKVVLIQLMGSWCPNCMDETKFLSEYYNKNRDKGFEVVALAYERSTDFERSRASLQRFRQRFHVQYPVLVTGVTVSDPQRTEKTLPQLDKIAAFPTSLFIDRKGNVRKIYSGFSGPGTGAHYEEFRKEFDDTVRSLLNETL